MCERARRPPPGRCAYDLGIKITVGLELLAQGRGKHADEGPFAGKHVDTDARRYARDWTDYIDALISQSYFSGDTGSDQWYEDVDRAKDAFTKVVMQPSAAAVHGLQGDALYDLQRAPCFAVRSLSAEICSHLEYADALRASGTCADDDDDGWMELRDGEMDDAIRERGGRAAGGGGGAPAAAAREGAGANGDGPGPGAPRRQGPDAPSTDRLADFVTRMNEFIESSSGMDGVEVPEAAAAPRQPAAKPRANEFLPEDSLELETETMIGALRRALQVDVAECSSSDSDDIDDEDDEDDDGGLGGLFGDDEQDEEDREITNEVLCELSDYVKKRKEEETRARAEARLRGRAAGAEEGPDDENIISTIHEIKKSLVLDEASDDSDDDSSAGEAAGEAAGAAMRAELDEHPALRQQSLSGERAGADARAGGAANGGAPDELTPLDIDYNLVKNLLDSVIAEEGLPGPASSLMRSLGMDLEPEGSPAR